MEKSIGECVTGSYEEKRKIVSRLNLMDDIFFSVILDDREACEYLLSALLNKKIRVIRNKTQYSIKNILGHSVILDALVEDEEHRLYDVEMQITDDMNIPRRMRYYQAMLDSSFLEKGADYNDLPETYIIFITSFDTLKRNKASYEVKRYIDGEAYDDGMHQLFFNTAVDDGSELSKLLQYLKNSDENNNNFGALSQAVRYHKVDEKGVEYMSSIVQEIKLEGIIEGKVETVMSMIEDGVSLDKALKYAKIDKETYEKYANNIQ